MRLYLEGKKCNRLAIHLQHLTSLPKVMAISTRSTTTTSGPSQWRGSDNYESNDQSLEPIKWKRYSNICTSRVEHDSKWLEAESNKGVFIVTGAQLLSKGKWPKTVLHLRLLYTFIPNCTIRKTEWAVAQASRKSGFLMNLSTTFTFTQKTVAAPEKQAPSALNSGVYPDGPPVPVNSAKLLMYVDTTEVVRGPHNAPGHWLVTAARLANEGGKIALHVKFGLLDYSLDP